MDVQLHHGDSRNVLQTVEANSLHSCVTDPPYDLDTTASRFGGEGTSAPSGFGGYARTAARFHGQGEWDTGETAFDPEFWRLVLRVLRPGAFLFAFSHARTYHRLATAIEAAGFEVRDQGMWVYGTGFPKSKDMAHAFETRLCERLPARLGDATGPLGWFYVDDGRPILREPPYRHPLANEWAGWGSHFKPSHEPFVVARKPIEANSVAANLERWGTGALNIDAGKVGEGYPGEIGDDRTWPTNVLHGGSADVLQRLGGAQRLFYCAKAGEDDRVGSDHPTVKPVSLMRWCVRVATPRGGVVLDPFAGSGTTGMAALREGFGSILVEREARYHADIVAKLRHVGGADLPLFGGGA